MRGGSLTGGAKRIMQRANKGRLDRSMGQRILRAECASNISSMLTTLDVSKFSGWLNALDLCRAERGGGRCGEVAEGRQPRIQRAREGSTGVLAQGS